MAVFATFWKGPEVFGPRLARVLRRAAQGYIVTAGYLLIRLNTANMAKIWQNMAKIWLNKAKYGQIWPNMANNGQIKTNISHIGHIKTKPEPTNLIKRRGADYSIKETRSRLFY